MRAIEFRGKSIHTGKWHYGDLVQPSKDVYFIQERGTAGVMVNSKTIGQFIGLSDRNYTKAYRGDIVKFPEMKYDNGKSKMISTGKELIGVIGKDIYCNWVIRVGHLMFHIDNLLRGSIIGNIYDNPELIKIKNYGKQ